MKGRGNYLEEENKLSQEMMNFQLFRTGRENRFSRRSGDDELSVEESQGLIKLRFFKCRMIPPGFFDSISCVGSHR